MDLICISKQSLYKVRVCVIEPSTLSDHGPIYLKLNLGFDWHFKYWRLNISLLTDPNIKEQIRQTIDGYFKINDNGSVSPSTLWDGAKAVLRGKCIEIAIKLNREWKRKKQLESNIKRLAHEHKMTRDKNVFKQLQESKASLDELLT